MYHRVRPTPWADTRRSAIRDNEGFSCKGSPIHRTGTWGLLLFPDWKLLILGSGAVG